MESFNALTPANDRRPNRRELAFALLTSAVLVAAVAALAALIWSVAPRDPFQPVGQIDTFPTSSQPYFVNLDTARLVIVNTGDEVFVFDAHSTRPGCFALISWNPDGITNQGQGRFEEPCHGAKYALAGDSLEGIGPPARSLDGYEYEIRNGELWVCLACAIPGDPPLDG